MLPFDDRNGWIWLDGEIIPWREATTHVLCHGLHYSTSVFEGERAYNGKIFKSRQHSERLLASGEKIYVDVPYTVEQLEQAKYDVLSKQNMQNAYVRAFAWFGGEQMGIDTSKCITHVAIACWDDWESYFDPQFKKDGLTLHLVSVRRPPPTTMRVHAKASGNYQLSTCAKREAQLNGADDALMLDWEGNVAESSGANIFFIKDGVLNTPKADRFLNGITRQTVIDIARGQGLTVDDTRRISLEELLDADEAFLTGSAAEVSSIGRINANGETYQFKIGQISKDLTDAYSDLVRS
jgi:branched-chain amino acid aminotransferase